MLHVPGHRRSKVQVDAKLADFRNAVTQPAGGKAVKGKGAVGARLGAARQHRQLLQIAGEPGRAHGARRQAGHAHEFDNVLGFCPGQHLLEVRVRVAFLCHGEGRADLHGAGAKGEQVAQLLRRIDAAGGNERHFFALYVQIAHQREGFFEHARELEARVGQVFDVRRTEVAAGVTRVLDDDGVGQTPLLEPFFQHDGNAARVRQDGNERHLRKAGGKIGQVQRQARTHDDGLRAGLAGLAHIVLVFGYRAHDIDGDHATAVGHGQCGADFTIEGGEVGAVDEVLVTHAVGGGHQVRMVAAQVDAGNGADRAEARHAAGKPVCGDAHAHAALHDGQQRTAANSEGRQVGGQWREHGGSWIVTALRATPLTWIKRGWFARPEQGLMGITLPHRPGAGAVRLSSQSRTLRPQTATPQTGGIADERRQF